MSYSSALDAESSLLGDGPSLNGLPVQLTSFIGRERAMQEIARLFDAARLVTLTGPGGCGKTRLAVQMAPLLSRRLNADPIWIDLASINDEGLIAQTISRALNLAETPDGASLNAVIPHLQRRDTLLLFDNGEHLVEALAEMAELLLTQCPPLRLLVTSREALNIPGETAWTVPPLSIPDEGGGDPSEFASSEAVNLFVDRARSVDPSFALTPANSPSVIEICRSLDGMPLAIELAASRVNVLGPSEIANRLRQSFHLLTAGRRTALPRHRTLQATIDWSHELLSEPERRLFARLSIFNGGFSLDAIEDVCSDEGLSAEELLDISAQLAAKSLIVVERHGSSNRFRMLQTIHQYAREKLSASGELNRLRERHARWCVALAESGAELESAGQAELVERFEAEHDNFRAAMSWALESNDPETLARIAGALWRFWLMRGYLDEGTRWLTAASSRLSDTSTLRPTALLGAAVLTCHQADYERSRGLFEEAGRVYRVQGDRNGEGEVLYGLATVAQFQGQYRQAADYFEATLPLFNHRRGEALSQMGLALTLLYLGEFERSEILCQQSLDRCREIKDDRSIAGALTTLGIIRLARGKINAAEDVCLRSLELRRRVGDRGGMAHSLTVLGEISLQRGDVAAAAANFREALQLRFVTADHGGIAGPLEGVAAAHIMSGAAADGVREMAVAHALRARYGVSPTPLERAFCDRHLDVARERLGPSTYDLVWAEGLSSDFDTVLRAAISALDRGDMQQPQMIGQDVQQATRDADPPRTGVSLQICALGSVRVLRDGEEIPSGDWTYSKARELLFFLICSGPSTKEQIGLALWPDASDAQLRSVFHTTVHHLRRALGDPAWILFRNGTYQFNRARSFSYDVGEFERLLSRARGIASTDRAVAVQMLEQALAIYQGKYLADLTDSDWHLPRQEELEREQVNALLLLGDLLLAGGRSNDAEDVYRRALAVDEFLETAHRGLMQALAIQGERGKALRQYQALTTLLRDELSTEPDLATRQLYEKIQSDATLN